MLTKRDISTPSKSTKQMTTRSRSKVAQDALVKVDILSSNRVPTRSRVISHRDEGTGAWRVWIAIPGSRDSRIPGFRKFSNPEIPGSSRTPSRDFRINKIYLFNGLYSTFKNNIVHLLILWCVSQSSVRRGGIEPSCSGRHAIVLSDWAVSTTDFRVSYICLCLCLASSDIL